MIGLLWSIRGLGKIGRVPALVGKIRDNHVDFVGIMETKKKEFSSGFLKSLTWNVPFNWCQLEAQGTAGGILVGANSDVFTITVLEILKFSTSVMLTNKKNNFSWKLIVIYGPAYEDRKVEFLDELQHIMNSWKGPLLIGGDFNLVRFISDKSNRQINHRWAALFNNWISKWGLIELSAANKKFAWTNNQKYRILAKVDRIFVSTSWEAVTEAAVGLGGL